MKLPLTGPFLPARTISQSINNHLNNKDELFQLCAGIILIVFSILNHVIITNTHEADAIIICFVDKETKAKKSEKSHDYGLLSKRRACAP